MLDILKRRRAPPTVGDMVIYAVGDVHGRFDALSSLMRHIFDDIRATKALRPTRLILLGDYVDRGPKSRQVIEAIRTLKTVPAFEVIALKGNHEETLLQFLDDPAIGPTWMSYGGVATLSSYGVEAPAPHADEAEWAHAQQKFIRRLPPSHLELLQGLKTMHVAGDYAFVHAGVRPGVPLVDQAEADLLWIRDPFLKSHTLNEKVIVHGHTPTEEPYDGVSRIGVDTGAYATGVLTAVRLEGPDRCFLQGSVRPT